MAPITDAPAFLAGDPVLLHQRPVPEPAHITSVHRTGTGWEYVIATDGTPDRPGRTVNLFTTTGHTSSLSRRHRTAAGR
jgi:hypothetical protein